jgi:hypothetical protein
LRDWSTGEEIEMIVVRYEVHEGEGLFCHRIVCDWCNRPIEDARDALVLNREGEHTDILRRVKVGDAFSVATLHKGECCAGYERELGLKRPGWAELSHVLEQLLVNTGCNEGVRGLTQPKGGKE